MESCREPLFELWLVRKKEPVVGVGLSEEKFGAEDETAVLEKLRKLLREAGRRGEVLLRLRWWRWVLM